ncbi:MAG: short-chain fatty acyl-CoA regulator family protein [Pseudomonadota bacterium]
MARDRSVYIGAKLRRMRRDLGLTQAAMAADLNISASYVALMERNQRAVTADMLLRLAATYKVDLNSLADASNESHAKRVGAVFDDPLFADIDFAPSEAEDVAVGYPGVSEALMRLYAAYQDGQIALADKGADAIAKTDPLTDARQFLTARQNFFPVIDERAERLSARVSEIGGFAAFLRSAHDLTVRRLPPDVMTGSVRRLDHHRRELVLENTLDGASRTFQLCLQIAYLELTEAINAVVDEADFHTENGRNLARRAVANYAAGALMMPYRPFLAAAQARQYDVEALGRQFGASFEQTAHRLTTLQKPGREGVPFFFMRVDAAGNISKRLDGAGFPFARHGGSCPLWSVHHAFQSPRKIITQWVELPDGEKFFSIARTVIAGGGAYNAPRVERAVALGCAQKHAHHLIYAADNSLSPETATPIGVTCRLCQRTDCTARAEPPIGRQVLKDDFRRTAAPFEFADDL